MKSPISYNPTLLHVTLHTFIIHLMPVSVGVGVNAS